MADETIHKQEFNLRNVETKSVTLYPTRAQVVRDIKNITLRVCLELHHKSKCLADSISLALTRSQFTT